MCGISGIVSYSLSVKTINKRLKTMGKLQGHRGPDDRREIVIPFQSGLIGLGFVRLSILDLRTGMQPITCPVDKSVILCNGQIYNYIELKDQVSSEPFTSQGDIEVALHLYRKLGSSFLNHLNGMYAGAIYDPLKQKLLLFRDRFGIKPLYYTKWNNNFIFASEIKPLLSGSLRPKKINKKQIPTYFTYRYVPGEETMFDGVKSLPPGSFLEYNLNNKTYKIQRYWNPKFNREDNKMSLGNASKKLNELMKDAVKIRLRADVEVGAFLSGGIDSSAVASIAAQSKPDINLFTISFKEKLYNELPEVEKFIKTNSARFALTKSHTQLCGKEMLNQLPSIIKSLEEPICLGTILPTDQVCGLASNNVKTVLTGEGADEIFAGYRKFLIEVAACEYPHCSSLQKKELLHLYPELEFYLAERNPDPVKRYIQSERLFAENEIKTLLGVSSSNYSPNSSHNSLPDSMHSSTSKAETNLFNTLFTAGTLPRLIGNEHPLNAMLAMESRFRLPDYVILRLDKLSMRHSLETRTPFLDYRLAEFAATLPINFKVNLNSISNTLNSPSEIPSNSTGNFEKFLLRYTCEKYSILDKETTWRRKQPFTIPMANWFSSTDSMPDFIMEILYGTTIADQGVINPDIIKKLISEVSSEGIGPATLVSAADRIFAIIIFSLWYQIFFK